MRRTTLQFYKYPRTLHWRHDLVYLGEDHHGTWLGAPPGTVIQRGEEPPMTWNRPFVQLIQPTRPWIPIWNLEPDKTEIYVDITTVPERPSLDRFEVVDIDLDVVKLVDGSISVLDEDEFEEHRVTLAYPDWMVDQARATAAEVAVAIEVEKTPFDGAHLRWFSHLGALEPD
jgi:uncharacterized protein